MHVVDVVSDPFGEESERSIDYLKDYLPLSSSESILIYVTFADSVIPMLVLESESIGSVKLRIQTWKGFVVEKQKLVFAGRELARNDSLLKDYGVSSGNWLHLVVKLSDLILITVGTNCGRECEFHVDRHRSVGYVERRIAKKGKGFADPEDQEELLHNGEKPEDKTLIIDACKLSDAVTHLVVQKSAEVFGDSDVELSIVAENWSECPDEALPEEKEHSSELQVVPREQEDTNILLNPVITNPMITFLSSTWYMFHSVLDGLASGRSPIRSSTGTGGTYLMQHASGDNYVAIFKPIDEEPLAINSPQGLPLSSNGEGLKRGTRVGEGAVREVAAYLLDHPKTGPRWSSVGEVGYSGVPPTIMVHCLHRGFNHPEGFECSGKNVKVGSLQMFVNNCGSCEDFGPRYFPVEEVHKITVLDIRTANADRHAGNILVSREGDQGRILLIPIDHGYCLPENFEDCTFDWLYWPQSHQPYSQEAIEYIEYLDAEEDIELLQFHGCYLSMECARVLRISTMLLKKGVKIGLTPFAIGSIMCRKTFNKKSMIEEIVDKAEDSMLPGMTEAAFLDSVSKIMDIQLVKLIH